MITPYRTVLGLVSLTFGLSVAACSSDGAVQTIPTSVGSGGKGAAGASGTAGLSASAGTGSGGMSTGESGAGGEAGSGFEAAKLPWLHTEGNKLKDANGNDVVLRGVSLIDLAATEEWEGGINAMIDRLTDPDDAQSNSAGWGTKVLRLVVTPADTEQGSPDRYLPGTMYYEKYLRPTVDYAAKKGLYAIIDWHYIDTTTLHQDTTAAFWQDIAPRFKDDSNVLFELYNEPTNSGSWATVKPDMQTWYDIVREAAPDNIVLVGTPQWCQLVNSAASDPIDAENVMYVAHMYPQHWALPSLREQITSAAQKFPLFISEWGFQERMNDPLLNGTITSYGAPFKTFIDDLDVSWSAWCASSTWGPPMFKSDYTLRVGEGEMGGFAKDWLYEHRDADQPVP
jgi:endoglucanase